MAERTWRQKCGAVGVVVVGASLLAYVGKLMVSRDFTVRHFDAIASWAETGFLLGILGIILGLITTDKKFKAPVLVGAMAMCVAWFFDIAWSVVTK
jgi:hypothetical protein